jgi:hypothetical protein
VKIDVPYSTLILFMIVSLLLCSCVMSGAAPTATNIPTIILTKTSKPMAKAAIVPTPTKVSYPTLIPNLAATQAYENFSTKIREYYDAGYISTSNGIYHQLEDYKNSWAQINYYQWYPTGLSPTDFVLRTDISWKSASAAADSSGCGFVFRLQDKSQNENHYVFFLSLKGYIDIATNLELIGKSMGTALYGKPAQNGTVTTTLIVENNIFRVIIDNKLIKVYTGLQGKLTTGGLAYTIASGINTSYGTECSFKNTQLWELKK